MLLMQMEDLTTGLGPKENETKTMGTRRTEAARAAGEGAPCLTSPSLISGKSRSAYWICASVEQKPRMPSSITTKASAELHSSVLYDVMRCHSV